MVKHNSRIKIDVCKVTYMVFGAVKMQIMSILWVKSQFFRQNDIIEAQIESKVFNLWVLPTKWSTIFLKLFASSWQQKTLSLALQTSLLPLIIEYLKKSPLIAPVDQPSANLPKKKSNFTKCSYFSY